MKKLPLIMTDNNIKDFPLEKVMKAITRIENRIVEINRAERKYPKGFNLDREMCLPDRAEERSTLIWVLHLFGVKRVRS